MALTSKLCAGLRGYGYVLEAEEDLADIERDGRELAKRAVLEVLDCSLIVEVAVCAEAGAGVECTGKITEPSSVECWSESESESCAPESKAGSDGREGGSPSSAA